VRILGYAGLIPFIGLAFIVQLADSPNDLIALESLVAYGAVIVSFLGALHWGACFKIIGTSTQNRWLDHSVWIWGIMPALIAWLAIHIFIPLALLLLAATLIVQRAIDQHILILFYERSNGKCIPAHAYPFNDCGFSMFDLGGSNQPHS